MLKRIILGEENRPVKYHGQVKFVIFECNTCHQRFSKMGSYVDKQVSHRKNACCFCSPRCRSMYLFVQSESKDSVKVSQAVPSQNQENNPKSVTSWLSRLIHNT